ncbi:MAG TPA: s-methyl-5-thioribose-1-phosphate isomerase [Streptosporangiaceae bacterium]|nr:s-methyl-5-thioribose-1-phosphate isomerase [Streptosporangiaceae bacterium]
MVGNVRTIAWTGDALRIVDQTALPGRLAYLDLRDVGELVAAIQGLAVRGAPALGAAGAYGVAMAMLQGAREGWDERAVTTAIDQVRTARPTAVNLAAAVDRVAGLMAAGVAAVVAEADAIVAEDVAANHAMGARGADWLQARLLTSAASSPAPTASASAPVAAQGAAPAQVPAPVPASLAGAGTRPGLRLLTHCNTGTLATTDWGTALGVIRELHARGLVEMVYVDETRPLLQGARLTAWELARAGIPHRVQVDGAAASTICRGLVDAAIIGADRIAANGDTANKIGSLGVALACADAGIPFLVAAPWTTVDLSLRSGGEIPIEQRAEDEVLGWAGTRTSPEDSRGFNPAFDITPARLVTALVTETAVLEVSAGRTPAAVAASATAS